MLKKKTSYSQSQPFLSCKNKTVLITGGNGLIGIATAKAFLLAGAKKIFIADIAIPKELLKASPNIFYLNMDITSPDSIEKCFDTFISKTKKETLNILVNSAYPRTPDWGAPLPEIPYESFNENLKNHLGGYCYVSRLAAEIMKNNKNGGSIINISSIYGVVAPDFSIYKGTNMTMPAAYAPIKSGIIGFTRYLATYYGKYNIRANCISPGGVFNNQPSSFVKNYSRKVPLGRMARPDEIANCIVFLASDDASYITGQNIIVDGGFTVW